MAVLNASAANTAPIVSDRSAHSMVVNSKTNPEMITTMVAVACIHALCSFFNRKRRPLNAYLKLASRFLSEKQFPLISSRSNCHKDTEIGCEYKKRRSLFSRSLVRPIEPDAFATNLLLPMLAGSCYSE